MRVTRLKQVGIFSDLPEKTLERLAPFVEVIEIPEGKVLVEEGSFSHEMMVVEDGTARVEHDGEKVADIGPGDVIGEMGLLERKLRNATVTATSDMRLYVLTRWEISRLKRLAPEALDRLHEVVDQRTETS